MHTRGSLLDWIERIGNRLPEPAALFFFALLLVMGASQLAAALGWTVTKDLSQAGAEHIRAVGLLDADGLWWLAGHVVTNFIEFPPLGLVLVAMLGIGVAERSGLVSALLRHGINAVPAAALTPTMVFVGVMSSLALDAGYIVLPPLAAALYLAAGRPPLAGLAAVFAGISAGFSANLFVTAVDPLLAGLSQAAAQLLDGNYRVAVTANWWFMIASTVLLTVLGWAVTARIVEPRLDTPHGSQAQDTRTTLDAIERHGLYLAGLAVAATIAVILAAVLWPGAPLNGGGMRFSRWVEAIVPLLLLFFLVPATVFGAATGSIRSHRDLAHMMGDSMAAMGPYIVLAFFAAQFIAAFNHSKLGIMIAIATGEWLARSGLSPALLMGGFIAIVFVSNLFIGSASAKYALFAPVFVPMFMLAGISPELTQAAYRVGDSASNVITPLNPYFVIVLAFMRKYAPNSGLGTLVSLMLPYAVVFAVAWSLLLVAWMGLGLDLGPGGPLGYAGR